MRTRAEPLLRQALDIRRDVLGENHPDFATSLENLGNLYRAIGNHRAAEPLDRQVREIRRIAQGQEQPEFAPTLRDTRKEATTTGSQPSTRPSARQDFLPTTVFHVTQPQQLPWTYSWLAPGLFGIYRGQVRYPGEQLNNADWAWEIEYVNGHNDLGEHPKPAIDDHLKTGQR